MAGRLEAGVERVVIVGGYGPSLVRFRGALIRSIAEQGNEVVAMAPDDRAPAGLEQLGARYLSCPLERARTNPLADTRAWVALARQLRALRPDVVLTYNVKPMIYGTLAAAAAGVRRRCAMVTGLGYLFLPDGTPKQRLVRAVALPMYRAALTSATRVIVQNPDDERDLRAAHVLPRTKPVVRVAGSGIDLAAFPEHLVPDGPVRFLLIARLLRDKGVFEYVEAARRLRARWPDARFQILGPLDPNPSSVSEADVARWKTEGVVEYLGETHDVRPFLRSCTVFVLPSYREGTPRSVLEAMSTGRAVVTTDAPGCRETVVDGDNGYLVPVRDAGALAEAMGRFLEDPGLARTMGRRSRQLVCERFDVHEVNRVMLAAMGLQEKA